MNKHSKSGVFLIELLIIIAVFAVCSAICIQVMATAQSELDYSERLTEATNYACDIAERFRGGEEISDIIDEYDKLYAGKIAVLPSEKDVAPGQLKADLALSNGENMVSYLKITVSDDKYTYADITAARLEY